MTNGDRRGGAGQASEILSGLWWAAARVVDELEAVGRSSAARREATERAASLLVERFGPEALGEVCLRAFTSSAVLAGSRPPELHAPDRGGDAVAWHAQDLTERLAGTHAPEATLRTVEAFLAEPDATGSDPRRLARWVAIAVDAADTPIRTTVLQRLLARHLGRGGAPGRMVDTGEPTEQTKHFEIDRGDVVRIVDALWTTGELSDGDLLALLDASPYFLEWCTREPGGPDFATRAPGHEHVSEALLPRVMDVAWARSQSLDHEAVAWLHRITRFRGYRFIARAAQLHVDEGLKVLPWPEQWAKPSKRVVAAAMAAALPESDDEQSRSACLAALRGAPQTTLERLLPVARGDRGVVLEALGWESAAPLIDLVVTASGMDGPGRGHYALHDVTAGPDPAAGVLDAATVRACVAEAGDDLARRILRLFHEAQAPARSTLYLVEACMGWNRADVEAKAEGRDQLAVRALGLLPMDEPAGDVIDRLKWIRAFQEGSDAFGPQRCSSEAGAAAAALTNLARNAGYASVARMQLAIAPQLDQEPTGSNSWSCGDYNVRLGFEDGKPTLVVERDGRPLKGVPAVVRRHADYPSIKDGLAGARQRAAWLRELLEEMMVFGDDLHSAEIEGLLADPIGGVMLRSLVLLSSSGTSAMFGDDGLARDARGLVVEVEGAWFIAHAIELRDRGALAAWQDAILDRGIVQPFKQVFREIYPLGMESRDRTEWSQWAGREVRGAVTHRLFTSRSWDVVGEAAHAPQRRHPRLGVVARCAVEGTEAFLGMADTVTLGNLSFWSRVDGREAPLPLGDVPPVFFSEVMRDLDLVASVAAQGPGETSDAMIRHRLELLSSIVIPRAPVDRITVDGRFLRVRGKLHDYRIHVGSGQVFIEMEHRSVAVDSPKTAIEYPLPFPSDEDAATVEVLTKALMFAEDDQIKDEAVRAQIQPSGRARRE